MPAYPTSIVGEIIVGDGHVVGGSLVGAAGGVPSKGSFGTPTVKAAVARQVGGVASAQSFGTVTAVSLAFPQTQAVGSVPSKASFGAVVATAFAPPQTKAVPGLGSAQSFGTVRANQGKTAGGIGSAQAFGTPIILPQVTRTVVGLGSAQAFGTVTPKLMKLVGGVSTAQAFGTVTIFYPPQTVQVPGLEHDPKWTIVGEFLSGQRVVGWYAGENLWGTVTPLPGPVSRTVTGVPSKQAFGTIKIRQIAHPVGVPSKQAFGTSTFIMGPVWVPVGGVGSAQALGKPIVYKAYLRPPPAPVEVILVPAACTDLALSASPCTEVLLVPAAWTEQTLTPSAPEDLVLVPSVEE